MRASRQAEAPPATETTSQDAPRSTVGTPAIQPDPDDTAMLRRLDATRRAAIAWLDRTGRR